MSDQSLWDKIERVNARLLAGEPGNTSQDHRHSTGYKLQAIIDAVNAEIGPESVRFRIMQEPSEISPKVYETLMSVEFYIDGIGWLEKCPQYGSGRGEQELTDGKKAAITDAIKKGFSAWSIGNRAFLGLLGQGQKTPSRPATPPPHKSPETPRTGAQTAIGLSSDQLQLLNARVRQIHRPDGTPYFDRDTYRAFLQEHFQVSSQSELPMAQFGQVMITLDLLEKSLGTGKAA